MTILTFGCDVSGYQPANLVPWGDSRIGFGIVKFSEGAGAATSASRHCAAIRAANKTLGAYHFFHPDDDAHAQFETFDEQAAACGYGQPNDMVPAVDVEYFKGHGVSKAWTPILKDLVDMLTEGYNNQRPLLYINAPTWQLLGSPDWVLECPLWVPWFSMEGHSHPPSLPNRLVPGGTDNWAIWQFMGGKLFGEIQQQSVAGAVDQNWAKNLPLIGGA